MSDFPERKHARAQWFEYNEGLYFITICTKDKGHNFGYVSDGEMHLSELGYTLYDYIATISEHYPNVDIPQWVVMPNHFHAIVCIIPAISQTTPTSITAANNECAPNKRRFTRKSDNREILAVTIGGLKAAVTRHAHQHHITFAWQSGFHDRIIRNEKELNLISEYISNNPARWCYDCFNPFRIAEHP